MHKVTEGLPAYFITHICYGAFRLIYPRMLEIPVDNFDLEMSNNQLSLLELFRERRFSKDISFGVLDVHSHVVEEKETVEDRLRQALEVLDLEQIWVDPDCGLKTRTVEEAQEKMRVLVTAVQQFRARYAKSSSQVH
ncbi:MAG: methionine synthase, partial [Acidobacteria bacterium]|nr:methionine synthase [Acidobacteriota bacterium]